MGLLRFRDEVVTPVTILDDHASMSIPAYIERRIRQPVPADSNVVVGSTPVVAFGETRRARIATLGLNPSKSEFVDTKGVELRGRDRRLATHTSLGNSDLTSAPSRVISQVMRDCELYFRRNPYRRWFDQLEPILARCDASYYDGTACHLDLVQWATDPTWNRLPAETRRRLITSNVPFLIEQLANERIEILLLNGAGVIQLMRNHTDADLVEINRIIGFGRVKTKLCVGTVLGRIKTVGWSTNVQSSFGVSRELKNEIARRAGSLARQN